VLSPYNDHCQSQRDLAPSLPRVMLSMQRINVMVSDEAWQYLKDFQETGGYLNFDEAANALLLDHKKIAAEREDVK
jgi:hypothetical protein